MSVPQMPHSVTSTVTQPWPGAVAGNERTSRMPAPLISLAWTSSIQLPSRGGRPGDPSEDDGVGVGVAAADVGRPDHAARALTGGEQAGDGSAGGVEHAGVPVDPRPAGGEADRGRADLRAVERRGRDRLQELRV